MREYTIQDLLDFADCSARNVWRCSMVRAYPLGHIFLPIPLKFLEGLKWTAKGFASKALNL